MGEVLILIIIALVWGFKAAVANEDKKVNDRETGSISASPDELIKKANRTLDDLDTMRAKESESKKRPSEALDRQVKKENENPSVGLLLCASKNDEVVEYAMSRTMSPMLVSQYQLQLPDKTILEKKLQQLVNIPQIED